jgi:putative phosphoesterase
VRLGLVSDTNESADSDSSYPKRPSQRLGLVSDTHDNLALSRVAARFFREERPGRVLHLGDITGGDVVGIFAGLPMTFLRGNNDDNRVVAPALARHGFPKLQDEWTAELAGVLIAAHHGHVAPRMAALAGECDLLLHGHTHRRRAERVGRTLVVNPGALHRALTKSVALVELPSLDVRFFEVTREGVAPLRAP